MLLNADLVTHFVLLKLVLYIRLYCFLISPYRIHKISSCPKMPIPIFVFQVGMPVKYHQAAFSLPYEAFQDAIRRYNNGKAAEDQLPLISFHGLRHTSATLMIASRQDVKTVSSRLGHAQTSTTMNIYTHALQESDRKAADAIENLLSKEA